MATWSQAITLFGYNRLERVKYLACFTWEATGTCTWVFTWCH